MVKDRPFKLGDRVHIAELQRDGRILAIYENDAGLQYNVRYFDKGDAKTVYFYPDEIEKKEVT